MLVFKETRRETSPKGSASVRILNCGLILHEGRRSADASERPLCPAGRLFVPHPMSYISATAIRTNASTTMVRTKFLVVTRVIDIALTDKRPLAIIDFAILDM